MLKQISNPFSSNMSIRAVAAILVLTGMVACTTTPSVHNDQEEDDIALLERKIVQHQLSTLAHSRARYRMRLMGVAIGASISMLTSRLMSRRPARKYANIDGATLYDLTKIAMLEQHFDILEADREKGTAIGKTPTVTIKTVLFWKWKRATYMSYVIQPDLENPKSVSIYLKYWAEEKAPLSPEFTKTELNPQERDSKNLLLTKIDFGVKRNGGTF